MTGFVTRVSAAPVKDARWNAASCYDAAHRGYTVSWPIRQSSYHREGVSKKERAGGRANRCVCGSRLYPSCRFHLNIPCPIEPLQHILSQLVPQDGVSRGLVGLTVTCSPRQREEFIGCIPFLDPSWTCPGSIIGFNKLYFVLCSAPPASRHEAQKPTV